MAVTLILRENLILNTQFMKWNYVKPSPQANGITRFIKNIVGLILLEVLKLDMILD